MLICVGGYLCIYEWILEGVDGYEWIYEWTCEWILVGVDWYEWICEWICEWILVGVDVDGCIHGCQWAWMSTIGCWWVHELMDIHAYWPNHHLFKGAQLPYTTFR